MGQRWLAAGLGALSVAVPAWDILKEVSILFITSTVVWHRSNNWEGTQPHLSTAAAAAAAAKSLQSSPTLCGPIGGKLPGSSIPWILQAGTLEWVPIPFSNA